jgi:hypothetical protein
MQIQIQHIFRRESRGRKSGDKQFVDHPLALHPNGWGEEVAGWDIDLRGKHLRKGELVFAVLGQPIAIQRCILIPIALISLALPTQPPGRISRSGEVSDIV